MYGRGSRWAGREARCSGTHHACFASSALPALCMHMRAATARRRGLRAAQGPFLANYPNLAQEYYAVQNGGAGRRRGLVLARAAALAEVRTRLGSCALHSRP